MDSEDMGSLETLGSQDVAQPEAISGMAIKTRTKPIRYSL